MIIAEADFLLKFDPESTRNLLCCAAVNETFMMEQADRLVSSGLAGAGYEYVIVDGEPLSPGPQLASTFWLPSLLVPAS